MTAPGTVLYEVNAEMAPDLAAEFETWLKGHVVEMLKEDGFKAAYAFRQSAADDGLPESAAARFVVQYEVESARKLNHYLAERASVMRADGLKRFGDRIRYSRRVLEFRWKV
jgi:hypothetical protein